MTDYKKLLQENYEYNKQFSCPPESKLEYIGNYIFDFTTYCPEMDELFAKRMIEVLDCIYKKEQYEYHGESDEKFENYLLMVNMPFLVDKLEWGTNIFGAWFDFDNDLELDCGRIIVKNGEFKQFIKDLIDWSK